VRCPRVRGQSSGSVTATRVFLGSSHGAGFPFLDLNDASHPLNAAVKLCSDSP
jgi:hypothetical protein